MNNLCPRIHCSDIRMVTIWVHEGHRRSVGFILVSRLRCQLTLLWTNFPQSVLKFLGLFLKFLSCSLQISLSIVFCSSPLGYSYLTATLPSHLRLHRYGGVDEIQSSVADPRVWQRNDFRRAQLNRMTAPSALMGGCLNGQKWFGQGELLRSLSKQFAVLPRSRDLFGWPFVFKLHLCRMRNKELIQEYFSPLF